MLGFGVRIRRIFVRILMRLITYKMGLLYSAYALINTPLIDTFSLIDTLFELFFTPLIDTFALIDTLYWGYFYHPPIFYTPNGHDFFDTVLFYFSF